MSKELEQFENRNDDWLAKERKEEDRVSAWDFDEGKRIKEIHEEKCEARQIKETHERIHAKQNIQKNIVPSNKNSTSGFISILFIIIGFNIVGSLFFKEELPLVSPFIVFVFFIVIVSILKKKGRNIK